MLDIVVSNQYELNEFSCDDLIVILSFIYEHLNIKYDVQTLRFMKREFVETLLYQKMPDLIKSLNTYKYAVEE
jgi:hypothetical protein